MLAKLTIISLLLLTACGPRQFMKMHFASSADTNKGRAIPVYVIPLNNELKQKLEAMSAEDIILSKELENMINLYKLPLRGTDKGELVLERKNERHDFLVVVDYAEVTASVQQKKIVGEKYYRSKELYVLLQQDRLKLVSKANFYDLVKGAQKVGEGAKKTLDAVNKLKN